MKFEFNHKKISGVMTIVPKEVHRFDDEMENYHAPLQRTKRLKKIMGFNEHRYFENDVCVSDVALAGLNHLFENHLLEKEEIGALLVVTQSPDFFMPNISHILHGECNLSPDVFCLDLVQGCAAFVIGLVNAFTLMDTPFFQKKKMVLINGDVLVRKISQADRNSFPLAGDAVSITILENTDEENKIYADIKFDGTRCDALKIPAGGFRLPSSAETAKPFVDEEGNERCLDNLTMKGGDVFNFMQTDVPPLIETLLQENKIEKDQVDYFLFHQPNKFMVDKLAQALGISNEKLPSNIVTYFGNASGVTIPTNLCFNVGEKCLHKDFLICFAGFGVGLTWGALLMKVGHLDFCELDTFDKNKQFAVGL